MTTERPGIPVADRGVADGVPTLDGTGKIPVSQLPASVVGGLKIVGTWNAATNTPTLASGVGTEQEGWNLSPEIGLHLESAAEVIVRTRSSVEVSKIAHRVIGDASTVLNQCGAATAKEATLAAAFFILELVDKGAIADPTSRAILAALAIAEEAKQGTGDAETRELEWTYTETKIGKFVNAIRTKSEFLGYF